LQFSQVFMSTTAPARRRVSRETRQLLLAALAAIVALWVLSRIRFPDEPRTVNPIPTLLSQPSAAPRLQNLAGEVDSLQQRLSGVSFGVAVRQLSRDSDGTVSLARPAVRLTDAMAVLWLDDDQRVEDETAVLGADRATGLTVLRAGDGTAPVAPRWVPTSLDTPQYLLATTVTATAIRFRPVLVLALNETASPAWSGPVWTLPRGTDIEPGALVFSADGELAGMALRVPDGVAIVPAEVLTGDAAQTMARDVHPPVDLGVQVQALSSTLVAATGAEAGVVVSWVDPRGPAGGELAAGDVIQTFNGVPVVSVAAWTVMADRASAGRVELEVWRRRSKVPIAIDIAAPEPAAASAVLGLSLRRISGVGAAVVKVESRTAADAAGLREGDVITRAADIASPEPGQIRKLFDMANSGEVILLAITRGDAHRVVGVAR
jgi:hypothetical protein